MISTMQPFIQISDFEKVLMSRKMLISEKVLICFCSSPEKVLIWWCSSMSKNRWATPTTVMKIVLCDLCQIEPPYKTILKFFRNQKYKSLRKIVRHYFMSKWGSFYVIFQYWADSCQDDDALFCDWIDNHNSAHYTGTGCSEVSDQAGLDFTFGAGRWTTDDSLCKVYIEYYSDGEPADGDHLKCDLAIPTTNTIDSWTAANPEITKVSDICQEYCGTCPTEGNLSIRE